MTDFLDRLEKVFVDRSCLDSEVVQTIKKSVPSEKIEVVDEEPFKNIKGDLSAQEFDRSKRNIYVTNFKGSFFKRCPGARPGLTCCNYFVLNLGSQCDMNCSYCYLQSFINSPVMTVYANIDQALDELREMGKNAHDQALRVGTGETIDSLSLDPLTLYSKKLIKFFEDYPNWRLEFKTKSDKVDQFIDSPHSGNVIVSWSVNPQYIIDREEHLTASLEDRLKAARRCADKGYLISFHLDPVIWHEDWKKNYSEMVEKITSMFSPEEIPVMSVGALRFQPEQRHLMRERFGMESLVLRHEMFPGADGKYRYDKQLRSEMFNHIVSEFKNRDSKWNIFLCMETPETWLSSMKQMPKKFDGLTDFFDHNVIRKVDSSKIQPVQK